MAASDTGPAIHALEERYAARLFHSVGRGIELSREGRDNKAICSAVRARRFLAAVSELAAAPISKPGA
jgi:DNA-binding transcriptional LysR family regulator